LVRVGEAVHADELRRRKDAEVGPLLRRYRALTRREREVAERLERGLSSKQIAQELSASIRTVEHHRSSLLRKMAAGNAAELSRALTLVRVHLAEAPDAARGAAPRAAAD
jgi:two-component system response regulator DctR